MTTLGELVRSLEADNFEDFLDAHPHPVLLHPPLEGPPGTIGFQTDLTDARSTLSELDKNLSIRPDLLVTPLVKKEENLFPSRICVGRTRNNDLVIPHARISKFHAFFTRSDDGLWFVTDAGSTNGTYLDGKRLPPKRRTPLEDRTIVSFGRHFHFRFHTPRGLYDLVCTLRADLLH